MCVLDPPPIVKLLNVFAPLKVLIVKPELSGVVRLLNVFPLPLNVQVELLTVESYDIFEPVAVIVPPVILNTGTTEPFFHSVTFAFVIFRLPADKSKLPIVKL